MALQLPPAAPAVAADAAQYSDAQLRAAWQACRRRTWPASFEAAMQDPLCSRIVRLHAWLRARPRRAATPADATCTTVRRPAAQAARAAPAPTPRPAIDRKRAASGERDDD